MRHNRKGGGKGHNSIPDGWRGCPSMSTGFIDDRFFVFKTPFKPELNGKLSQEERFSVDTIWEQLQRMNNSRIGLWIDLTNTSRYYDPSDVVKQGMIYEKFACEGHGSAPSKQAIFNFCGMVDHFFKRNKRDYIGIHCTHGFNRTGFLICSYLIRFRRYSAEEAVMEFARHRQPGIYRQNYVDALYKMSNSISLPLRVIQPTWLQQPPGNRNQQPSSSSTSQPSIGNHSTGIVANMSASSSVGLSNNSHYNAHPCSSSSGACSVQKPRDNNTQTVKISGRIPDVLAMEVKS